MKKHLYLVIYILLQLCNIVAPTPIWDILLKWIAMDTATYLRLCRKLEQLLF